MDRKVLLIAYVDLGVGSLLMQLALGGVAGLLVIVRVFGSRLKLALSPPPQNLWVGDPMI